MAIHLCSRSLPKTLSLVSFLSRSFSTSAANSAIPPRSSLSLFHRLRPLAGAITATGPLSPVSTARCFATNTTSSSLKDPNPNWSNRPPKETILLDGCDFEHWLIVMEPPTDNPTRDEIIDSYIKTLSKVIGSEEEARMKIYSVSTRCYYAFGALVSEDLSYKIKELPGVRWVLPDSYLDVKNKDYGGEPFINGQAVPYDPKYHEEWIRNNAKANERNRRNDRPRNFDRSRNFDRRRENMQNRDFQRAPPPGMNAGPNAPGMAPNTMLPPNMSANSPNNMGPPPNMGGMPPPNSNMSGMPPPNSNMGGMPPPNSNMGGMPPPNSNMGGMPPPNSNMGGMPPPNSNMGGMPPPNSNMGGMPPPNSNMGGMPPPNRNMGGMPPPNRNMGGMPPPNRNMDGMPPPNGNMGGMPPPNHNMGGMPPPNSNTGPPPPNHNWGGMPPNNNWHGMPPNSNMGGMPPNMGGASPSSTGGMPLNTGDSPLDNMGGMQNIAGWPGNVPNRG